MLCEACKFILKQPLTLVRAELWLDRWQATSESIITFNDLELKADHCYGCNGILRQVTKAHQLPQANDVLNISSLLAVQTSEKGTTRLWNKISLDGNVLGTQTMDFERAPAEGQEKVCISKKTGSMETLEFIKERLDDCRAHHKSCSSDSTRTPPWYPTRLIHVQKGRNTVRLVETAETKLIEPYSSLSHCWGQSKILRLTQNELPLFKDGIPFSQLPKTFQEALQVVKSLGLSYIWIDSLCIIQDSDQDWRREAQTMLNVYKYAICNIAATRSDNSYGGLFVNREPDRLGSGVIDIDDGVMKGRYYLIDTNYFAQEIDEGPLNRRGWVIQERMLSRRIIHFASEQVFWDCPELTACEAIPEREGSNTWPILNINTMGAKKGSEFYGKPGSVEEGLSRWARIVNIYSEAGLSIVGDKFIAISGLAEQLRDNFKLEYHAGLWASNIEVQLAWLVVQLQTDRSPPNDLAPTWSWASINGSVSMLQPDLYDGYNLRPLSTVTQIREWKGGGLPDRVEKNCTVLTIRGILNPIKLHGDPRNPRAEGDWMNYAWRATIDTMDVLGADRLFFLPLFEIQMETSLKEKWRVSCEITGIIVQAVHKDPGAFTRCGRASISCSVREDTRTFDAAFEAVKSPGNKAGMPCEEYDPNSGHLITLI